MYEWLKKLTFSQTKNETTVNTSSTPDTLSKPGFIRRYADYHSIFSKFEPWEGIVPKFFDVTEYGSFIRRSFYGRPDRESEEFHKKSLPRIHKVGMIEEEGEYFELIDVLESIDSARENFTMVELGAGYGRWLVLAAVVIRNNKNIPFHLIGVEPEHSHYQMMSQHFVDNELNPKEHMLIEAAVTETDGPVYFTEGHSKEWWGQAIVPSKDANFGDWPNAKIVEVNGLSINTILKTVNYVDLMDMDIQGAEFDAIRGSLSTLKAKVKRIRIATHSKEIEDNLYDMLSKEGWICCNNFPAKKTVETHYGIVIFPCDGLQTWINLSI